MLYIQHSVSTRGGIYLRFRFIFSKKYCWKRILLRLFVFCCTLFFLSVLVLSPPAIQTVSSESRRLPIYSVDTNQQAVAISFDASWGAEHTLDILDTLDAYNVKATFFLVNIWVEEYPDMAREIAARGHEIGLHSVSHPRFSELNQEEILAELTKNFELIQQTTGYCPTLFRPPFGDYNNQVIDLVNSCGYDCIQWSKDSLDWKDLSADAICQRVLQDIHAGDIILFHNNGLHTAEALPQILDSLSQMNLTAVPVGEILLQGDTYIDANGVQHSK